MNSNACLQRRLQRYVVSACLLLTLVAATASPALSAPEQATPKIPDLLMLVWVREQMDSVSYTYQNVVKRSVAQRHLANLLQETGWTANNVYIQDLKMADGSATTTVEFTTLGTVNLASGGLPIEPIVKAFKDLRYLEIQFMVSMPFSFRGLQHFENKYVKIVLNRGTNVYGYSVFINDRSFRTLNLPLVQPETSAAPRPAAKRSNLLDLVLIVLLGTLAAMLVYCVMRRTSRGVS